MAVSFHVANMKKTCTPNTDENNNNSDTDLSDNDNEVSFNRTFIQANDVQLNDTETKQIYYNDTHTARADQVDPIDMTDKDQSTSICTSADTCVCSNPIDDSMLQCDMCKTWVHYTCASLPDYELARYIKTKSKKYMCHGSCLQDTKLCTIMEKRASFSTRTNQFNINNDFEVFQGKIIDLINERLTLFSSDTLKLIEEFFLKALETQNESYNKLSDVVGNVLTEQKIISQKLDNQISSKRENKNIPNVSSICSPKCSDLEKATTCLKKEVLSERGRIKLQFEG